VTEPSAYDVDLDAGLEQMHGGRVAEDMRRDPSRRATIRRCRQVRRMPTNELLNPVSGDRPTLSGCEYRSSWWCGGCPLGEQLTQQPRRL